SPGSRGPARRVLAVAARHEPPRGDGKPLCRDRGADRRADASLPRGGRHPLAAAALPAGGRRLAGAPDDGARAQDLGKLPLSGDMDFELSPTEKAFREEVRTWLKANVPAEAEEPEAAGQKEWIDKRRAWQKKLHEAGYVGIGWPKEYGGRGATLMEQLIFNQETIAARAPQPINVIGLGMGGPVVITHGTDEQKRRYLEPLLSADEIWFTDVKVPKSQLLGEAGEGWAVAMTTLLHERGTLGMALATQAQLTIGEVAEHARKLGRGGERLTRQRIAQHQIEARALQLNGYRAITKIMKDGI